MFNRFLINQLLFPLLYFLMHLDLHFLIQFLLFLQRFTHTFELLRHLWIRLHRSDHDPLNHSFVPFDLELLIRRLSHALAHFTLDFSQ